MTDINWKAYSLEQYALHKQAEKALLKRIESLEQALREIAEGHFSLTTAPDYVTNPTPSPQQIARSALDGSLKRDKNE
jgi:F420-0:gamma-glutamyl ligase-like protein